MVIVSSFHLIVKCLAPSTEVLKERTRISHSFKIVYLGPKCSSVEKFLTLRKREGKRTRQIDRKQTFICFKSNRASVRKYKI